MGSGTHTFLIEHYRPSVSAAELAGSVARLRQAVRELEEEGKPLRLLHSTVVPQDESLLCLLEATSEQLVREACARAGFEIQRISRAIAEDGAGRRPPLPLNTTTSTGPAGREGDNDAP